MHLAHFKLAHNFIKPYETDKIKLKNSHYTLNYGKLNSVTKECSLKIWTILNSKIVKDIHKWENEKYKK